MAGMSLMMSPDGPISFSSLPLKPPLPMIIFADLPLPSQRIASNSGVSGSPVKACLFVLEEEY